MGTDDRHAADDHGRAAGGSGPSTQDRTLPRRAWALLSGTRTAAVLIAAVTVLSLVGMAYPQDAILTAEQIRDWRGVTGPLAQAGEALGLNDLFATWYFIALLLLLTANAIACTVNRLARRGARSRAVTVPAGVSGLLPTVSCLADAEEPLAVASVVVASLSRVPGSVRWASQEDGGGSWRLFARGGYIGFWGSMIFHAALVITAAGVVVSALTTFRGTALVTESQTFTDAAGDYLFVSREPRFGSVYSGAQFVLDDLEFIYEGDVLTRAVAHTSVRAAPDSVPERRTAEVNYPLEVAGKSFLLGNSGYSVGLTITAAGGISRLYYTLGQREPSGYSDELRLPGGVIGTFQVVPSADVGLDQELVRRFDLTDPVAHVRLMTTGRVLWEGVLAPGQTVTPEGYELTLTDVKIWTEMRVRGDSGRGIVYAGLWLAVAGMLWRLLDAEQSVFVHRHSSGQTTVAARHRFGPGASAALALRVARRIAAPDALIVSGPDRPSADGTPKETR